MFSNKYLPVKRSQLMNILSKITNYILDLSPEKVSKDKIVSFLLGEKIEEEYWDVKYLYDLLKDDKYRKDKFFLPKESLIKLTQSIDWSNKRLSMYLQCKEETSKEITKALKEKLCSDNEMCISNKRCSSIENLLKRLVYKHFFGTDNIEGLFEGEKIVISPNHVVWELKEEQLAKKLKKHHLTFITGVPSNGKSTLVKHYFYEKIKMSNGYLDFTWLICDDSSIELSEYNIKLNFLDKKENKEGPFKKVIHSLEKKENAYMVVYRPILSNTDLDFILNIFKSFKMRILVITRRQIQKGNYGIVHIGKWPQKKLKEISDKWLQKINEHQKNKCDFTISEKEYRDWFNEIEFNPYLVELICKSIKKSNENSLNKIKLSDYADKKGHSQSIHTSYRRKRVNDPPYPLKTLLTRILEPYSDEIITEKLSELSLWTRCVVSKEVLIQIGGISEELINDALEYSFLVSVSEEKNLVQMPRILAEAIWRKTPIEYEKYKEIIGKSFLAIQEIEQMPDNFSYIALYDTWQYMIERIHKDIITIRSENKRIQNQQFEGWTEILESIKDYAESLGNTKMLCKINSILYIRHFKDIVKDQATAEQALKKKITEVKRLYIEESDMEKAVKEAEFILNNFLQSPGKKSKFVESSYIILDMLQWFVDQHIKNYINDILRCLVNREVPNSKSNVLAVLKNYITQIQKYGIQDLIQYNGQYYTSDNNFKVLYYQMLYNYIDSIPNKDGSLYTARGLYHKFVGYVDSEWRVRGLLQSQLYEEIYIVYNICSERKKGDSFKVDFELIEARIMGKNWPQDIMELYYMAGILYYLFIEKNKDKKLKSFLLKMKETYAEQFTMSEADILKFQKSYEDLTKTLFSTSFEKN